MLIERDELLTLLGVSKAFGPGESARYVLPGSGRRASLIWDRDRGVLTAQVTEDVEGEDANLVVSLEAAYDDAEEAFEATGSDDSGEGDPRDPRAAAVAWRRMVRPMEVSRA